MLSPKNNKKRRTKITKMSYKRRKFFSRLMRSKKIQRSRKMKMATTRRIKY